MIEEVAVLTFHLLLSKEDKVLLVRHREGAGHLTGVYGIPGGRPEHKESFEETAKRELAEETGLQIIGPLSEFPNNIYTADIERKDGTIQRYTMRVFVATEFTGELASSAETQPEWVRVDELVDYELLPNVKEAIGAAYHFLKHHEKL